MPSSAGLEFDTIFKATSANSGFTNITLEMQSPLGIATTVFDTASHYLYLGDADRFDMAVFDLATSGSLGTLTWEFSDGSNGWTAFTHGMLMTLMLGQDMPLIGMGLKCSLLINLVVGVLKL
jgi:hypothetical protein